ncbi:Sulfotransferase family protein [Bacillus subtilis]|nr:Sulfotransferase family protein [Bacillus subtilis]
MEPTNELIIFIHIAKTGGTTLRGILEKQYNSNLLNMYADVNTGTLDSKVKIVNVLRNHIDSAKCISGHFSFGIKYYELGIDKPLLPLIKTARPIIYISMLRKPVDQIFSLFLHYKRNHWLQPEITFEDFIKNKLYILNYQTLCLSGTLTPNVNIAKQNIIQHFALVGITDMYNESIFLLKQRFHWKDFNYHKLNKSLNSDVKKNIPQKLIDLINHDNELDLKLYTFTKELLKIKIDLLDSSQKEILRSFSPFL